MQYETITEKDLTQELVGAALKDASPEDLPVYIDALVERAGPENIRLLLGAGTAGRTLPQDVDAEKALLGAMMQGGSAMVETVVESLSRADFYVPAHATIFDAMLGLAHAGKAVDRITTAAELVRSAKMADIGGVEYLAEIATSAAPEWAPTSPADSVKEYTRIVSDKAALRGIIETAVQMSALAYAESASASDIAAKAETAIFAVRDRDARSRKTWQDMPTLLSRRLDSIFKQHKEGPAASVSIPTGISELDRYITLKPGTYNLLAGRPSMGKTSLAICIGKNAARAGYRIGIFSQEMTDDDLTDELLSLESGIDGYKFEHPWKMNDDDLKRVTDGAGLLWKDRIAIDDTEDLTPSEIAARARRLRSRLGGLDLIIVDYLQICRMDGRRSDNRNNEVGDISRELKNVAKRLRVPMLVLSQLSRAVEKRDNKRPMLSDLYESGSIEANADLVLMIYRPAYYAQKEEMDNHVASVSASASGARDYWSETKDEDEDAEEGSPSSPYLGDSQPAPDMTPEEVEIIVAKQKKGRTGIVKIGFIPHLRKFAGLAEDLPDGERF